MLSITSYPRINTAIKTTARQNPPACSPQFGYDLTKLTQAKKLLDDAGNLIHALETGNIEAAKPLITNGNVFDYIRDLGVQPLSLAVETGNTALIEAVKAQLRYIDNQSSADVLGTALGDARQTLNKKQQEIVAEMAQSNVPEVLSFAQRLMKLEELRKLV